MKKNILIVDDKVEQIIEIENILTREFENQFKLLKITSLALALVFLEKNDRLIDILVLSQPFTKPESNKFLKQVSKIFNGLILIVGEVENDIKKIINTGKFKVTHEFVNLDKTTETYITKPFCRLFNEKEKIKEESELKENSEFESTNSLVLSSLSRIKFVKFDDILYLEADGRCTKFCLRDGSNMTSSKNLGAFTKELNNMFYRIHKRYIVNVKAINYISKQSGLYCILNNGDNLPISGSRKEVVSEISKRM